ncbi:MAG: DUF2179 domain-containing protein [Bacteroidetes bacterium]|nr:DUF2179 domain-containing protein [Bacteroidota bacterium]
MSVELFSWVVLPLIIFVARIFDQTVGTIRLIFAAKGFKSIVPVLGFFEVLIWIVVVAQVMQHLDNVLCYIAYAGGFAMGNYIGMIVEERLSLGTVLIRVIPKKDTTELIGYLRSNNYGVTAVDVEGRSGKIKMLFSIIKRKQAREVIDIINRYNPNAFYTIEEIRAVKDGYFKPLSSASVFSLLNPFHRSGK